MRRAHTHPPGGGRDRRVSPDIEVLLANGCTRPLGDLRIGDGVHGLREDGAYRRYVITDVLGCEERFGSAYRLVLQDGTRLLVGRDHCLLSDRGWKYASGVEQGAGRRPHLTRNNSLMGVGGFAPGPTVDDDYRRGYLCGMIRGDGSIGHHRGSPGASSTVHRFRLALADSEALDRSRGYLRHFDVPTFDFVFSRAAGRRREARAIRSQSGAAVARIEELIGWPAMPPREQWRKGFLAGVFDAERSCSQGVLRFSNSDALMLRMIEGCLRHFGFRSVREGPRTRRNMPVFTVRLRGGLRERMRFFHTCEPAITRKRSIAGTAVKSDAALGITSIVPLPMKVPLVSVRTVSGDFVAAGVVCCGGPRFEGEED